MTNDFKIDDNAFEYLAIQKGDISHFLADRPIWEQAYEESIKSTLENIKGSLPDKCSRVLDVGGGLGGIDIALNRHYKDGVKVTIIDGAEDEPVVHKHGKTFSNATVAYEFQKSNGVEDVSFLTPEEVKEGPATRIKYDLVVSFASYAFHYSPAEYLDYILKASKKTTIFIFDVRTDKPEWIDILCSNLELDTVIHTAKKYERMVFKKKQ